MKTESWNGYPIRFVERDGEWWAVAKDVSVALNYSQVTNMLRKVRAKEKGLHLMNTLGGSQEISVITEKGIYAVIMRSRRKEAEDFQDWVFETLKILRQSNGLEGFQIFRMLDKDHQKEAMAKLKKGLKEPGIPDFIKANTIANKAVSTMTLEREEQEKYNERLTIGRIADQKEKYAKEQPAYNDAPVELVSASDLIKKQQDILAQNGENQRKRERLHQLEQEDQRLMEQIQELLKKQEAVRADLSIARMNAKDLEDQSTAELERSISDIEEINRKVRANLDKEKAEDDAREYRRQYDQLSKQLDETRDAKNELLKSAELPLPELSIKEGRAGLQGSTVGQHVRIRPA